jgi:hypothetical protein
MRTAISDRQLWFRLSAPRYASSRQQQHQPQLQYAASTMSYEQQLLTTNNSTATSEVVPPFQHAFSLKQQHQQTPTLLHPRAIMFYSRSCAPSARHLCVSLQFTRQGAKAEDIHITLAIIYHTHVPYLFIRRRPIMPSYLLHEASRTSILMSRYPRTHAHHS